MGRDQLLHRRTAGDAANRSGHHPVRPGDLHRRRQLRLCRPRRHPRGHHVLRGVIINGQNQPVQGANIVSPQGGIAQSDANGAFCLAVPVFQSTEVYVQTELDETGYQPVSVYSQPGTPDCQGGCANVVVLRPYTETTCAHGGVIINNQQSSNIPVQVFDESFPEVAVYTTLTGADGSYCVQLPATGEVTVQVGSGDNLCGSETVNTASLGGEVCDESSQSECLSISDFVCSL